MSKHPDHRPTELDDGCLPLPRFERVKYFYGQLLGVREFQSEQAYFYEKHRLHNRYLHGYGVICGLGVGHCRTPRGPCDDAPRPPPPAQEPPAPPAPAPAPSTALVRQPWGGKVEFPDKLCLEIDCGLALDCQGNEIVVPWPAQVDVLAVLGCDADKHFLAQRWAYVSICYHPRPVEPVRPISSDNCGALLPDCVPSRVRDDYCVRVSWEKPEHDDACSACARPCCDPCLPLARIGWDAEQGLVIDNSIRRTLSLFTTTRVKAISWAHGASYRPEDVDEMLRYGLRIEFTDGVRTSTLRSGVIDVWVMQGGGGRRGDVYNLGVRLEPSHPQHDFSTHVTVHLTGAKLDRIDPGDRVLIQLRSAFVLDRCCRALDGEHIGGLVPTIPALRARPLSPPFEAPCRRPEPHPFAPWTSGNGTPGGNFESWFYVGDDDAKE